MQKATSFGGPFVLLPARLVDDWADAVQSDPNPDSGQYGAFCDGDSLIKVFPFHDAETVRLGQEPSELFWLPALDGGLLIQWIGADSLEALIAFAQSVAARDSWDEAIVFNTTEPEMVIMDSCGFDGDDQPKIQFELKPGQHLVQATYAEDSSTMAAVFRLRRHPG